ncbi:TolC family protein [Emticicia sp.]|uniref:TolC family protein n=1 Tax=Emticicia sp. TaxID=1930953 RepID=UPI003751F1F9
MNLKIFIINLLFIAGTANAQVVSLENIKETILSNHPTLKMYDADVRSMDEAAKGAKSWMPPEVGAGFFMTPYNPKYIKRGEMGEMGMGQFMIAAQQMLPNKSKLEAEFQYMKSMSSVEKEKKNVVLNDLITEAKKNYYEWMIIKKKSKVLSQNEKLLAFMIQNAELLYKNNMGKLSAYYKAKAALGNLQSMQLMLDNDIQQKRISLNTVMNRDKNTVFDIDTTYFIKDFANFQLDSTEIGNVRSDIKAIDREINLTELKQNVEQSKLKPEYGVRFENMIGLAGQPLQFTAMAMVKIPFARWSAPMYKANIESLRWKKEALGFQKQMVINELTGMAAAMRTEFEVKKRQIKLLEDNIIPALTNNYKTMQLGYQQNTEELFMLFDAWETLNMTQIEYLNQVQQLLLIQVAFERILEIK